MAADHAGSSKYKVKITGIMLAVSCINFSILQVSSQTFWQLLSLKPLYALANLGILLAFTAALYACTNKLWTAETLFSGTCTIYAIANIYVVEFHRTPLTIPEFANARTALNVLKGYSFIAAKPLILLLATCLLSFINFLLIRMLRKYEAFQNNDQHQKNNYIYYGKKAAILLCGCVYTVGLLHMDCVTKPIQGAWHFKEAIGKYGYPLYFLASGFEYEITAPSGYSGEALASIPIREYSDSKTNDTQTPDIILILNETFYDISLVTDIETDVDYMGAFYNMENSISGHVIVPKIGGGTNSSEYELLTANSTYLMQGITPFQILDVSDAASMVSNLKELGYYTIAMHPAAPENYARNMGYPRMGFDEIHFLDDFTNRSYYGSRMHVTDTCAYENMIQWYENAIQQEKPVFGYLLTIQNHGEWDTNPAADDIVHVTNADNNLYKDNLNEFLSCISLSTDALNQLTEYFRNSDRPVVLCMAGDHAPSFIEEITDNGISDKEVLQRATPFIIWANFPIDGKKDVLTGMNALGPLLLDISGVKMLPYYNYLQELVQNVPVLTSFGNYIDADGAVCAYTDEGKYSAAVQKYFWLEYDNLQKTSSDGWFSLQPPPEAE